MRCISAALIASLAFAAPAMAQQRVVVPAGAEVVIAPRGTEGPALVRAPRPRIGGPGSQTPRYGGGGDDLAGLSVLAPALLGIPLIALATIAARSTNTVPGVSSGTSAPARTR
jgi:hypothetical protein